VLLLLREEASQLGWLAAAEAGQCSAWPAAMPSGREREREERRDGGFDSSRK